MRLRRRNFLRLAAGAAALPVVPRGSRADTYPSRPVHILCGFAPGGAADTVARLTAEWLSEQLGQQFVVDNRPGAGGLVGSEAAANAQADGYTVLMGSFSVLFVSPYLAGKSALVPLFAPISILSTVPMILVGKPDGRFADMKASVDDVRDENGARKVLRKVI